MADLLYIIGFLEEVKENPIETLHLTIMQDFSIPNRNLRQFLKDLEKISVWFHSMELETTEVDFFGPLNDIQVMKVGGKDLQELKELHSSIFELIYKMGGNVTNPEYCLENFQPHLTGEERNINFVLKDFECIHHSEGFGKNVLNLQKITLN